MMLIITLMVFVEVLKRSRRSYMNACEECASEGGGVGGEDREPGYNHTHDFRSKENNLQET
jgi:hypothetical protein